MAWFYAIIFGAPALVMGVGIFILYGRRQVAPGEPEPEKEESTS